MAEINNQWLVVFRTVGDNERWMRVEPSATEGEEEEEEREG